MNIAQSIQIANKMITGGYHANLIFSEREAIRGLLEAIEHYREVIAQCSGDGVVSYGWREEDGTYYTEDVPHG